MEFEPFSYHITNELVNNIIEVTGNDNALYHDDDLVKRCGYDGKLCPQACAVIYSRLSYLGDKYQPPAGGVLASMSLQFHKPIMIGDTIVSKAKVVSKEERKGRKYFTLRTESLNGNGVPVSTMEMTGIWPR